MGNKSREVKELADEWFEGNYQEASDFIYTLPYSKIPDAQDAQEVLSYLHGLKHRPDEETP